MEENTVKVGQQEPAARAYSTRQRNAKQTHRKNFGSQHHESRSLKNLFRAALMLTALQLPYLWFKHRHPHQPHPPTIPPYDDLPSFEEGTLASQSRNVNRSRRLQLTVSSLALVSTALVIYTSSYVSRGASKTGDASLGVQNYLEDLPGNEQELVPLGSTDGIEQKKPVTLRNDKALSLYTMAELEQMLKSGKPDPNEVVEEEDVSRILEDIRKALDDEQIFAQSLFDAISESKKANFLPEVEEEINFILKRLRETCAEGRALLIEASRIQKAKEPFTHRFWDKAFDVRSALAFVRRDMRYLPHQLGVISPEYR